MGRVVGDLMTVEWQKRGLPHIHILIIFAPEASLKTAEDYDEVVCAEISLPNHPLHEKVLKHMIHTCGSRCQDITTKVCKEGYPKPLVEFTNDDKNRYPEYCRRPI